MTPSALSNRLGIFGGSFDPVHLGHLLAAQDALEQVALDRVIFMPAAQAPLKDRAPGLPATLRLELLRLAVADDPRFDLSTREIERGGVSFTVDTVRDLRAAHPEAELFWIIGADQAVRLTAWREIDALVQLAQFIVLARPGFVLPAPEQLPPGAQLRPVAMHSFAISSSEIRDRVAAGKSVRYFLPAAVADRIARERLYSTTEHAHTA